MTVETADPDDDKERDLWGNVVETPVEPVNPKPKAQKVDPEKKPAKTPKWKEWVDDLFNSMNDDNV